MDVLYEACAGLDVHAATVVACVRRAGTRGRRTSEVRTFGTITGDLLKLADWLTEQGVTHVAMESTGVLWKPVFNILEGSCTVILVNAQHIKAVPGRKTDVKDSEWLAQLLEHGLLRASFIPPPAIRELRDLTRRRKSLIEQRASETNRVQKLLESANIKLGLVATDILGASGRAMLRALVAGERDGAVLADLAKGTLRQKRARLAEALTGRFTAHHAALLDDLLAHIEFLDGAIERLSQRIAAALEPQAEVVERLEGIPGVNRQAAEMILAEIGLDMSQFPTAAHLAAWAGICPGNEASAGKRKTGKTRKGNRWLKSLLAECGWGAGRARHTYLGAQYVRLSHRRGKKKAVLAVGHSILVAAYYILRDGVPYRELGPDHFDRLAKERLTRHYLHRLEQLGHHVTLAPEPVQAAEDAEPGAA
jgi:transposase